MSDGLGSSIAEAAKNTTKGFVKGALQEVSQTVTQGVSQVAGEQQTPEQMAQRITIMKQEDARNTQIGIANATSQLKLESQRRDEPQLMAPIAESTKKPMISLGELVTRKRDNKENKIAAA